MGPCFICGFYTRQKSLICPSCRKFLDLYKTEQLGEEDSFFQKRYKDQDYLEGSASLYLYRGHLKRLIQLYKFENCRCLSLFFAEQIQACLKNWEYPFSLQLIPPARGKLYKKGWDQMKEIGKSLRYPLLDCLKKRKSTNQKELGKKERWLNADSLFSLKQSPEKESVVLILDDIETTGATILGAAECLKKAGVKKIYSLTLALD